MSSSSPSSSLPSFAPANPQDLLDQCSQSAKLESQLEQEQRFLKLVSLILLVVFSLATVGVTIMAFVIGRPSQFVWLGLGWVSLTLIGFGYWCSGKLHRVRLGSWLVVSITCVMVVFSIIGYGLYVPTPAFFLTIIMLSLFLLPWWATLGFGLLGLSLTVMVELLELNGYNPFLRGGNTDPRMVGLVMWSVVLLVPTLIAIYLWSQYRRAYNLALGQTERLNLALTGIEGRQRLGLEVSQYMLSMTSQLNATAGQQASGSQQQVGVVADTTRSLKELAQSANSIAARAKKINQATGLVLTRSQQLRTMSEAVVATGKQGLQAVERTIISNQQVSQLYSQLVLTLTELHQRSGEIKQVLNLLHGLSDETHLLALNAAIEAAGAGEYGARFAVVARQVKSLAERSLIASKQVDTILSQVEAGIAGAVLAAETGQQETRDAFSVAQESGSIIGELAEVIQQSSQELCQIELAVQEATALSAAISSATSEQSSASLQAVQSLEALEQVAQNSATSSLQINGTAQNLEALSHRLTEALAAR